ncbi:MAG: hypothetical protein SF051_02180 [Elusimicrobiota bacterium]|nr:hypothetical protein [Elusimicrobiota bacterium]
MKNLKVSGQLDVQTTSARNVIDFLTRGTPNLGAQTASNNDRIGHAHTRTMVSADWDLLDDVHARITLVKGVPTNERVYGGGAESLDNVTARTLVQEAHVKIDKLMGLFDTTIGRQFYGEAGDLIAYYGPRDNYGLTVAALDAFRFDWKGEHMMVTGLAGRMSDTNNLAAAGNAAASVDVRGLIASCNQHEMVKPTVYLYNQLTHAGGSLGNNTPTVNTGANGKNTNLYVIGAKAKITAGGLNAHVEFAKNFGDDRTTYISNALGPNTGRYTGYAILGKLGYKADVQDVAAFNPWGEFGMGSGDANFAHAGNGNFQSIATDYRPGGIYGRFDNGATQALASGITTGGTSIGAASNGLSNRVIWGAGIKATPAAINKLTAGLAYYRYAFHRAAPTAAHSLKPSRNIGSEVDVTAEWKHSDNVGINVTLGSFLPGAYIADMRALTHRAMNPATMAAADVKIRF